MRKVCHISNNAGCRTDTQRWLFGGKELLTEFRLNEYDFEARRLVPLTGRFTQPDPFGFLTPETSPYAYCAADPVNFIDPTGEHVYQIDPHGNVSVIENYNYDQIELVDEHGNIREDESGNYLIQEYSFGTIKYKGENIDMYGNSYFTMIVRGDNDARQIFEWLSIYITSQNGIEFSLAQTGNRTNGKNYINCGHLKGKEPGISDLFLKVLQNHPKGYLRNIIHSHPLADYAGSGDLRFKSAVNKIFGATVSHYIFLVYNPNKPRYIRF